MLYCLQIVMSKGFPWPGLSSMLCTGLSSLHYECRNTWGKSPWAGTANGTYSWPTFTASERNCAEWNNCTPWPTTLLHDLTVCFLLLLQMNFAPLHLMCFLWPIAWLIPSVMLLIPQKVARTLLQSTGGCWTLWLILDLLQWLVSQSKQHKPCKKSSWALASFSFTV